MRYRYLDDFRRGILVFAIFSYGIAVLGTPQCPPPLPFWYCLLICVCKIHVIHAARGCDVINWNAADWLC